MATDADLLTYATKVAEMYCNTYFSSTTVVDYLDGGDNELIATKGPIISITSIEDTENDDATLSATAYDFDPKAGIIYIENSIEGFPRVRSNGDWGEGRRRWKVTYQAGYSSMPDDVTWAVLMMATEAGNRLDPSISSESLGDYSKAYMMDVLGLNPKVKAILDRYKVRRV